MTRRYDTFGFGFGIDFGFILLVFVGFMENYFNNFVMILVSMGFGSVLGPCLFVVDLSGSEVCLEVWTCLVGSRFFISFSDRVGKDT